MLIASLFALADISTGTMPTAPTPVSTAVPAGAAPFWKKDGDRLIHHPSGMSIPLEIPGQQFVKIGILSHHGSGLDDALEWRDTDRDNYTTLFIFRPTLADTGLAAAMSGLIVSDMYGAAAHAYDDRVVPAGGVDGTAREILYDGATVGGQPCWTGAAFLKVGPWLVAARMSGAPARKAELEAALTGLLDGLRFAPATPVHRYHALTLSDCPLPDNGDAHAAVPGNADALALMLVLATTDSGIAEKDTKTGKTQQSDLSRVPDTLCRATIDTGHGHAVELWPANGSAGLLTRMSRLVVLNDAGAVLEISESIQGKPPFYVIRHDIGEARIVATLDAPPSQAQLMAMIGGTSPLLQPVTTGYGIDAQGKINLYVPPDPAKGSK